MKTVEITLDDIVNKIREVNIEFSKAELQSLPESVSTKAKCLGQMEILSWILDKEVKSLKTKLK